MMSTLVSTFLVAIPGEFIRHIERFPEDLTMAMVYPTNCQEEARVRATNRRGNINDDVPVLMLHKR